MNKSIPFRPLVGFLAALALTAGAAAEQTEGDTVSLSVGQQRDRLDEQSLPKNGMTREAVQSRFGEPRRRVGPVGEPPISRWVYTDYVVYFEHDRVLRSVVTYPEQSTSGD